MSGPPRGSLRRCMGVLALTLSIALLLVLLTALPWRAQLIEYRGAAAERAEQLARFEARLSRRPEIERALEVLRARADSQRSYVQGQTLGLAGANLQQLTKGLIEAAGGRLISSQIATPPAEPPLQMLVNKVRMRGDTPTLLRLAYQVESGRPVLFMENLVVGAAHAQKRSADELEIQFDLVGYTQLAGEPL